jgi:hypothetical protein
MWKRTWWYQPSSSSARKGRYRDISGLVQQDVRVNQIPQLSGQFADREIAQQLVKSLLTCLSLLLPKGSGSLRGSLTVHHTLKIVCSKKPTECAIDAVILMKLRLKFGRSDAEGGVAPWHRSAPQHGSDAIFLSSPHSCTSLQTHLSS